MLPLQCMDDEIGRKLEEARRTGELESAEGYGKPLPSREGWDQTPESLRMGFKILKDAGVVPLEVELFQRRARLRAALDAVASEHDRRRLQMELNQLEQNLALRLEALRVGSTR